MIRQSSEMYTQAAGGPWWIGVQYHEHVFRRDRTFTPKVPSAAFFWALELSASVGDAPARFVRHTPSLFAMLTRPLRRKPLTVRPGASRGGVSRTEEGAAESAAGASCTTPHPRNLRFPADRVRWEEKAGWTVMVSETRALAVRQTVDKLVEKLEKPLFYRE
ncbi:hypothetical protein LZ31DRAFT_538091 [Colletotrichum somersetense]|nr:hypothetical protein LZ31DRAFT_538091 [Colletotrichum somersetense]